MKNYTTTTGENVNILDARIIKASGYGQYKVDIDFEFEGKRINIKEHSTDSVLYDDATDADDHSAFVMEEAKYSIESAIDNYFNEL